MTAKAILKDGKVVVDRDVEKGETIEVCIGAETYPRVDEKPPQGFYFIGSGGLCAGSNGCTCPRSWGITP